MGCKDKVGLLGRWASGVKLKENIVDNNCASGSPEETDRPN
jgi:hypothetical protein